MILLPLLFLLFNSAKSDYKSYSDLQLNDYFEERNFLVIIFIGKDRESKKVLDLCDEIQKDLNSKDTPIQLVYVEPEEEAIHEQYGIEKTPKILLLDGDGKRTIFDGHPNPTFFLPWITKLTKLRTKSLIKELRNQKSIENFSYDNQIFVVLEGAFKDIPKKKLYEKIANSMKEVSFVYVMDPKLDFKLMVYNNQEVEQYHDSTWNEKSVSKFIRDLTKNPFIRNPHPSQISDVKAERETFVMLVYSSLDPEHEKLISEFKQVWRQFGGKYTFSILDRNNTNVVSNFTEIIFTLISGSPCAWIFDHATDTILRYKYTGKIESESLFQWVVKYRRNKLTPYWVSEPIPDEETIQKHPKGFKRVVADTYLEYTTNPDKDLMMLIHGEYCSFCDHLVAFLQRNAPHITTLNPGIEFSYISIQRNEIPYRNVKAVPTLFFFKKGNSVPLIINALTVNELMAFLSENASFSWVDTHRGEL